MIGRAFSPCLELPRFCMRGAVPSEYRLQPEVNKGLQAREALFSLKKGVMGTGLKPLNHFRLKAVLRPGDIVR